MRQPFLIYVPRTPALSLSLILTLILTLTLTLTVAQTLTSSCGSHGTAATDWRHVHPHSFTLLRICHIPSDLLPYSRFPRPIHVDHVQPPPPPVKSISVVRRP